MVPEFNIKRINSKLSNDARAHISLWIYVLSMVTFYVITKGIHNQVHASDLIAFAIAIGLLVFQGVTRFLPVTRDWESFNSGGIGAIVLYNLAISIILIWCIPLYSPFVLILPPVLFITIYYRGMPAYLVSLATVTALAVAATIKNGTPPVPYGNLYPYFTVVLIAALGGLFTRAGDIDEQIRQEFAKVSKGIELSREQLSSVINNIRDSIVATDRQGNILFYNQATSALIGDDKVMGKKIQDVVHVYDRNKHEVKYFDALLGKSDTNTEVKDTHMTLQNNEKVDLYIEIIPVEPVLIEHIDTGFIVIIRDISKQKSLEDERDEFISITSHELRTPVATIEASLSLLTDKRIVKNLDAQAKKIVRTAYDSILYLADLTNQLAALSSAESQSLQMYVESIDASDLLKKLCSHYEAEARSKKLSLEVKVPDRLVTIKSSRVYVTEILQNFITNALKYTNHGSIVLEVSQSKTDGSITFSVKDSGVGIGVSDKPKIFSKYYRSEDYKTRQTSGTGLGLYLSKKLTEHLKGKIWFISELNKGSTFYLQLPNNQ